MIIRLLTYYRRPEMNYSIHSWFFNICSYTPWTLCVVGGWSYTKWWHCFRKVNYRQTNCHGFVYRFCWPMVVIVWRARLGGIGGLKRRRRLWQMQCFNVFMVTITKFIIKSYYSGFVSIHCEARRACHTYTCKAFLHFQRNVSTEMHSQCSHYHVGNGGTAGIFPVRALTAYNFLRSYNHLLNSHTSGTFSMTKSFVIIIILHQFSL